VNAPRFVKDVFEGDAAQARAYVLKQLASYAQIEHKIEVEAEVGAGEVNWISLMLSCTDNEARRVIEWAKEGQK
jgi:hypothetical protein